MTENIITEFENRIGYNFKNRNLLRLALTHSSYANEHKMSKLACNERLEFLGDAVLEIVVSEYLFNTYTDVPEGELTKLRASIVCEPTLALCSREIDLGETLFLGKGEDLSGGRYRNSITSDAMEAVIGAIYSDGGMEPAKKYIYDYILNDIDNKKLFVDSKTNLQEIVQSRHNEELSYVLLEESGPDHCKVFKVGVKIGNDIICEGTGRTKKAAEQEAAYNAILKIK